MSGWLSFLIFAAFFYLMMRFGCGAHMVHGGHGEHGGGGHGGHGAHEGAAKDPVCGMTVEPGQGYSKNHEGRLLHFCSRKCLDKFEAEPQRYLS
jgi:YHS domain-containing protein